MASLTDAGVQYSVFVGCIYIFNLIVGTGALALPKAFVRAGWFLSTITLMVLAFVSYITMTYVVESMACANALLHFQQHQTPKKTGGPRSVVIHIFAEKRQEAESGPSGPSGAFSVESRVELGGMANMFFNSIGKTLFYLCTCIYLYGDLAIYAVAVARTLMKVCCKVAPSDDAYDLACFTPATDTSMTRLQVYRVALLTFILVVGPFSFFNVQKTKYLQLLTTVMRWLAFGIMTSIAIYKLATDGPKGQPAIADFSGLPTLFGSSVYAFMCHHSIPGLISPIRSDSTLYGYLLVDYVIIITFYILLSLTGAFAFASISGLYTLNFIPQGEVSLSLKVVEYYLALFPVFTLSTTFPIICITLRNTLMNLCLNADLIDSYSFVVRRLLFPLLALCPPVLLSFVYQDITALIKFTGSYAGSGIQYFLPTFLVIFARRKTVKAMGPDVVNQYRSPFSNFLWAWAVILWGVICLVVVSVNQFTNE